MTYGSKVCFALSLSLVFSHMDKICDSEYFFNSLLELLYNPEEQKEVKELLSWWNQWAFAEILLYLCHLTCTLWFSQVFPNYSNGNWTTSSTWVSSEIKQRRAAAKKAAEGSGCAVGFSSVIWASHCSFVAIFIRIDLFCKEWTYGSHWQCESRCCWFYNKIIVKDLRRMLGNMIVLPTFVRWYQYVIILPSTSLLWLLTMCVLPYKILSSSPSFWCILYGIFML